MTLFKTATLAATVLASSGFAATAAHAAPQSQGADARAKVLKRLTLTKTSDLDFGIVVPSTTAAGTVTVNNTETAATCSSGMTCTKAASASRFTVTGSKNEALTVSYPATVTLQQTAGTGTATGTGTAMVVTLAARPTAPRLDNKGDYSFAIGGSLAVGADQADGNYAGTFNVTVDYS